MVQVAPSFDVKALDALVTPNMVDVAILEAEADHEARQAAASCEEPAGLMGTQAIRETNATEVLSAEAQVAPLEENVMEALVEDEVAEVVLVVKVEVAEVSSATSYIYVCFFFFLNAAFRGASL